MSRRFKYRLGSTDAHRRGGFTLIEVMVTVAIVGILAAIAFPSYQAYIIKANRRNAQAAMMDFAQRQQQYLLDQRSYGTKAEVGFIEPSEVAKFYTLQAVPSVGPPPGFEITATPKSGTMQAGDKVLKLNHLGAKDPPDKW